MNIARIFNMNTLFILLFLALLFLFLAVGAVQLCFFGYRLIKHQNARIRIWPHALVFIVLVTLFQIHINLNAKNLIDPVSTLLSILLIAHCVWYVVKFGTLATIKSGTQSRESLFSKKIVHYEVSRTSVIVAGFVMISIGAVGGGLCAHSILKFII